MNKYVLPAITLLALSGAALAQNGPPSGGDRQMPSAEERFKRLDGNSDGKVTLDEYKAMRGMGMRGGPGGGQGGPPAGGNPPANAGGPQGGGDMSAMREERFKAADTNKDGSLSLEEYKAAPMGPPGGNRRN